MSSVLRSVISFRKEKTSRDRMYNDIIQIPESSKVGYTPNSKHQYIGSWMADTAELKSRCCISRNT